MATVTDIGTFITTTAGVCGGRPCIAGTGVSVRRIAGWYKMGETPEEITDEYEHVNLAQVYAALSYYHVHQKEIDQELADEEAEYFRLAAENKTANNTTP